jgi:polysaccharide export outer membrane protein
MKFITKFLIILSFLMTTACPALALKVKYLGDYKTSEKASEKTSENADDESEAPKDEFTIIAGDVLQITVWKEDGLDREIIVLQDGTITFPLIGTLQVQGLTPSRVQSTIKSKLKTLIPEASVTVMVKAPLGHTVSVLGQVGKPGEIVMARHMGVMEALSQVGGLTPYANTSRIVILRYIDGKKTSLRFPYDDIAQGRHLETDIDLKPGDVVMVPTAGLL